MKGIEMNTPESATVESITDNSSAERTEIFEVEICEQGQYSPIFTSLKIQARNFNDAVSRAQDWIDSQKDFGTETVLETTGVEHQLTIDV
jgi:hypothetical protein